MRCARCHCFAFSQHRIPFVSGANLLGLPPGDPGAYTLLADAIRQFGHDVADDLHELSRRLVFSLMASNFLAALEHLLSRRLDYKSGFG